MPCQWKYSIKLYKSELKNSCQSEWIYVLYTVPDQNEYMYLLYTVPDHNEYMYCTLSRIRMNEYMYCTLSRIRMNICTVHCPGSEWIYVLYTVPDQDESAAHCPSSQAWRIRTFREVSSPKSTVFGYSQLYWAKADKSSLLYHFLTSNK